MAFNAYGLYKTKRKRKDLQPKMGFTKGQPTLQADQGGLRTGPGQRSIDGSASAESCQTFCSTMNGLDCEFVGLSPPGKNGLEDEVELSMGDVVNPWTDVDHELYLSSVEDHFTRKLYQRQYCEADICGDDTWWSVEAPSLGGGKAQQHSGADSGMTAVASLCGRNAQQHSGADSGVTAVASMRGRKAQQHSGADSGVTAVASLGGRKTQQHNGADSGVTAVAGSEGKAQTLRSNGPHGGTPSAFDQAGGSPPLAPPPSGKPALWYLPYMENPPPPLSATEMNADPTPLRLSEQLRSLDLQGSSFSEVDQSPAQSPQSNVVNQAEKASGASFHSFEAKKVEGEGQDGRSEEASQEEGESLCLNGDAAILDDGISDTSSRLNKMSLSCEKEELLTNPWVQHWIPGPTGGRPGLSDGTRRKDKVFSRDEDTTERDDRRLQERKHDAFGVLIPERGSHWDRDKAWRSWSSTDGLGRRRLSERSPSSRSI